MAWRPRQRRPTAPVRRRHRTTGARPGATSPATAAGAGMAMIVARTARQPVAERRFSAARSGPAEAPLSTVARRLWASARDDASDRFATAGAILGRPWSAARLCPSPAANGVRTLNVDEALILGRRRGMTPAATAPVDLARSAERMSPRRGIIGHGDREDAWPGGGAPARRATSAHTKGPGLGRDTAGSGLRSAPRGRAGTRWRARGAPAAPAALTQPPRGTTTRPCPRAARARCGLGHRTGRAEPAVRGVRASPGPARSGRPTGRRPTSPRAAWRARDRGRRRHLPTVTTRRGARAPARAARGSRIRRPRAGPRPDARRTSRRRSAGHRRARSAAASPAQRGGSCP